MAAAPEVASVTPQWLAGPGHASTHTLLPRRTRELHVQTPHDGVVTVSVRRAEGGDAWLGLGSALASHLQTLTRGLATGRCVLARWSPARW
jgi:hypothetical protein